MFSKATLFATILAACVGASASPLDVWSPKIISPDATTVWHVGAVETVTWDTSDAPVNISNAAAVVLVGGGEQTTLASGFDLRSGAQAVTVPADTVPGDFHIILFGDSGNTSPTFSIEA